MKPGLDLKQDFLVDYKTDPYEKKNASAGNEKIVKALYEVALKYDTILLVYRKYLTVKVVTDQSS